MAKLKKKANTKPRVRGTKILGPSFEGWEKLEGRAFASLQRASVSFYYSEVKREEVIPFFFEWMANNGYTKDQIALAKKAKEQTITPYVYARVLADGCPDYNKTYADYWKSLPGTTGDIKPISEFLHTRAKAMISAGEKTVEPEDTETPKKVYKPSIQQIMFEQCCNTMVEIDEWMDNFDKKDFNPSQYDIKKHFLKHNVSQAHARKIIKMYEGELAEYNELLEKKAARDLKAMTDEEKDLYEQLKEGYSHIPATKLKVKQSILQSIIDACNFTIDAAAAKRKPRTPKARSADKIVKDIKYKVSDPDLNLASINPVEIVGASELWVYNVKTRKLGKYIAANIDPKGTKREGTGLSMKGTTVQGFDEKLSIQKTLRKPEEKLQEFKSSGKVALRKFMDSVNAVESPLNGRINAETILLKVQ